MKTKILGILVITLLISTTITVSSFESAPIKDDYICITSYTNKGRSGIINIFKMDNNDTIDQYNTDFNGWLLSIRQPFWRAQGFTPTLGILTRVELSLLRVGHPPQGTEITLSIRKSLEGKDLTEITVNPSYIGNDRVWVEFDFPDIGVNPSDRYYIIMKSNADNLSNCYYCAFGINNPYIDGDSWGSNDLGLTWDLHNGTYFEEFPWLDFCFKTYGIKNDPPNKPSRPSGKTNGKIGEEYIYTTSTTDPDGDDVYYLFDWGNGITSFILGPYESGAECNASGIWFEEGSYEIKVKSIDEHGAESDWSDPLSISMPKNKAINTLLFNFLENHPKMFPLLLKILRLQ